MSYKTQAGDLVFLPKHNVDLNNDFVSGGLTKREYFAALAMEGLLTNESRDSEGEIQSINQIVGGAVLLADALIERLNK